MFLFQGRVYRRMRNSVTFYDDGVPVRYARQTAPPIQHRAPIVRQRAPAQQLPRSTAPASHAIRRRRAQTHVQIRIFGQRRRRRQTTQKSNNVAQPEQRVKNLSLVLRNLTQRDVARINNNVGGFLCFDMSRFA